MTQERAEPHTAPESGYAAVNGLQMYYEIHGAGGTPLLLLHGGLFNIDLQFGQLLPSLAADRQVIAADFQGHGRTNDADRPLRTADLASDVVALMQHLKVPRADVFGFSVGGAVALHLAIRRPELVRKLIVSSVSFHPDGDRSENAEAVEAMTVDMIAGTPMEEEYLAKSPHPDRLADPAGQARRLRSRLARLERCRHLGNRRADPHHGRGLRRHPPRPHRPVSSAARR